MEPIESFRWDLTDGYKSDRMPSQSGLWPSSPGDKVTFGSAYNRWSEIETTCK